MRFKPRRVGKSGARRAERAQINFARDLQDRLGILALLELPAPFRICKLQIPLATRETDPVSGYHWFGYFSHEG